MMREKCDGDIVKPTPTRFVTNYIALKSLHDKKGSLRQMFTSEDWLNYKHLSSSEARLIANIIALYLNPAYQYEGDGLGTRVDLLKAMTDVVQQLMPFTNGHEQAKILAEAVIKQFGGTGYESSDVMVIDEVELQRHQQLEKLYRSTRAGKDFQKEIVRAAEALTTIGLKQIEVGTKLSEDCRRYGSENINDNVLAKAASLIGDARVHVEKEQEDLNRLFGLQKLSHFEFEDVTPQNLDFLFVAPQNLDVLFAAYLIKTRILEPLRAMIAGSPLEDARHLAQRYSRMRQEAETQAAEVSRRQTRVREFPNTENAAKLNAAESKMHELRANMAVLGKEAAASLAAVESQQQKLTFQRLVAMVEGERIYHERVALILTEVEAEMVSEKQRKESAPPTIKSESLTENVKYFLAEAMHAFNAASEKELSLAVGDYVVVRKDGCKYVWLSHGGEVPLPGLATDSEVAQSGWAEGECKGKSGWFPSEYVEKRQRLPTSNSTAEVF
ncbi:hypothetical protein GIB67_024141 [Kingdonia uniflora]|uniref:SH3 domain-containing protein n=1 Tax=Kingdonia uniflora TaxID=39325 RepID=A0A7J7MMT2_9MAGN|nr:hypothetical protein GIB67_024141 [Kingdonia uniflora]